MVLFWVDDCIFYAKSKKSIDGIIVSLHEEFLLEREEDMAGFLGINIEREEGTNTIKVIQTGLIERILQGMNMETCNSKFTLAEKTIVQRYWRITLLLRVELLFNWGYVVVSIRKYTTRYSI